MTSLGKRTLAAAQALPQRPRPEDLKDLPRQLRDAIRTDIGDAARLPEVERTIGKFTRALAVVSELAPKPDPNATGAQVPSAPQVPSAEPKEARALVEQNSRSVEPAREPGEQSASEDAVSADAASADAASADAASAVGSPVIASETMDAVSRDLAPTAIEAVARRMVGGSTRSGALAAAIAVGESLREVLVTVEKTAEQVFRAGLDPGSAQARGAHDERDEGERDEARGDDGLDEASEDGGEDGFDEAREEGAQTGAGAGEGDAHVDAAQRERADEAGDAREAREDGRDTSREAHGVSAAAKAPGRRVGRMPRPGLRTPIGAVRFDGEGISAQLAGAAGPSRVALALEGDRARFAVEGPFGSLHFGPDGIGGNVVGIGALDGAAEHAQARDAAQVERRLVHGRLAGGGSLDVAAASGSETAREATPADPRLAHGRPGAAEPAAIAPEAPGAEAKGAEAQRPT